MTAFLRVWRFTRSTGLVSSLRTVSLAGSKWGPPNRAARCQGQISLRLIQPPDCPRTPALSHFRPRTEVRLCVHLLVSKAGFEPASIALEAIALPVEL